MDGEVRGQAVPFDDAQVMTRRGRALGEGAVYLGGGQLGGVGGEGQEPAGGQDGSRPCGQARQIGGRGEGPAWSVREGRRVADDEVENAPSIREALKRLDGVGGDELHLLAIEAGQLEIAAGSGMGFGRRVHGHHQGGAGLRGAHGKRAGVGEQVQHAPLGGVFGDGVAAEPHVGKETHP